MIKFTFTEKNTEDYKTWLTFYPKRNTYAPFKIQLEKWGYFDPRPQLVTNVTSLLAVLLPFFSLWFLPISILFLFFGWGDIFLRLPFDTGKNNECESPEYTVMTFCHNKLVTELWAVWGKKRKHIQLPWSYQWVRTSTLLKNSTWFTEDKKTKLNWEGEEFGSYSWLQESKFKENYSYTDSYDNSVVNAEVSVEEREWRPRWFKWTKAFSRVSRDLKVDFDQEVGREKGSYKGGVLGCGIQMKKDETPLQALRRMEQTRKF